MLGFSDGVRTPRDDVNGRMCRDTLGRFPDLSVVEARANVSTTAIYARLDLDPVRRALEDNATMMLAAGKQTVDAEPKRSNSTQRRRVVAEGVDLAALVECVPGRSISLSRDELYRRVWSNPVESVARELGISGRGLAKIYARFEIPVPPRGYWAKLAAGKRAPEIPLPSTDSNLPSEIQKIATLR